MPDPLVSVCCTTYNHSRFVEAAVESVFHQTYRNLEILVIDDGSTDETFSKLELLRARSPVPMQVITQKNTGNVCRNNNIVLKQASGKYIRMLNLDDIYLPESTEEFVRILESDDSLQFVCADRVPFIDKEGRLTGKYHNSPFFGKTVAEVSLADLLGMEYSDGHTFYLQNAMFRKTAIDASGGSDEELFGDDITLRIRLFQSLLKSGLVSFAIVNHEAFHYRSHSSNLTKNTLRQLNIMVQVCEKYFAGKRSPVIPKLVSFIVSQRLAEISDLLDGKLIRYDDPVVRVKIEDLFEEVQSTVAHDYLGIPRSTRFSKTQERVRLLLRACGLLSLSRRLLGRNPNGTPRQ